MNPSISLSRVEHQFNGVPALSNIGLSVAPSETVALIGPSGSGKSTLLSLLDGRLRDWKGTAVVLERVLDSAKAPHRNNRADVGFIFQDFALVEQITVYQNVICGRLGRTGQMASLFGKFSDKDRGFVQSVLEDTRLIELAQRRVDTLSGGQRQRVAIARCLAQQPKLILADEPVSNLDPVSAEAALALISLQAKKREVGVIFTSHQPDLARTYADRVVGLKEGRILFDTLSSSMQQSDIDELYSGLIENEADELRLAI